RRGSSRTALSCAAAGLAVELFDVPRELAAGARGERQASNAIQGQGGDMARSKQRATTSDAVRFVLDGEVVTVSDVEPTRTVLNFLREDLGRTGTKEGCAEGDCGACTVVLGELAGDGVRFRAINSCIQFVPTLDGKELVTVESLKGADGALHPVQQALVDCHGSQCGFCTPGFVMSLFAVYKTSHAPTRAAIGDALV